MISPHLIKVQQAAIQRPGISNCSSTPLEDHTLKWRYPFIATQEGSTSRSPTHVPTVAAAIIVSCQYRAQTSATSGFKPPNCCSWSCGFITTKPAGDCLFLHPCQVFTAQSFKHHSKSISYWSQKGGVYAHKIQNSGMLHVVTLLWLFLRGLPGRVAFHESRDFSLL